MQVKHSGREDSLQTSKILLALQRHAAYENAVNLQNGYNQKPVQPQPLRTQPLPVYQATALRGQCISCSLCHSRAE